MTGKTMDGKKVETAIMSDCNKTFSFTNKHEWTGKRMQTDVRTDRFTHGWNLRRVWQCRSNCSHENGVWIEYAADRALETALEERIDEAPADTLTEERTSLQT